MASLTYLTTLSVGESSIMKKEEDKHVEELKALIDSIQKKYGENNMPAEVNVSSMPPSVASLSEQSSPGGQSSLDGEDYVDNSVVEPPPDNGVRPPLSEASSAGFSLHHFVNSLVDAKQDIGVRQRVRPPSDASSPVFNLYKYSHDETLLRINIASSGSGSTGFCLPVSLLVSREKEMRQAADVFGIGPLRWSESLLFQEWREKLQDSENGIPTEDGSEEITLVLNPERDCAESNQSHNLVWNGWLTSCIREYYTTGTIRISDECVGSDILLALEYFAIVYAPDQLVFDSFASYLRVKVWSDYFMQRSAMADWVAQQLLTTQSGDSYTFVTSPDQTEENITVATKRAQLLDGAIGVDASSCAVVYHFFNEGQLEADEGMTEKFDGMMREDFREFLQGSLPGTDIDFVIKDVRIKLSTGETVVRKRAVLHIAYTKVLTQKSTTERPEIEARQGPPSPMKSPSIVLSDGLFSTQTEKQNNYSYISAEESPASGPAHQTFTKTVTKEADISFQEGISRYRPPSNAPSDEVSNARGWKLLPRKARASDDIYHELEHSSKAWSVPENASNAAPSDEQDNFQGSFVVADHPKTSPPKHIDLKGSRVVSVQSGQPNSHFVLNGNEHLVHGEPITVTKKPSSRPRPTVSESLMTNPTTPDPTVSLRVEKEGDIVRIGNEHPVRGMSATVTKKPRSRPTVSESLVTNPATPDPTVSLRAETEEDCSVGYTPYADLDKFDRILEQCHGFCSTFKDLCPAPIDVDKKVAEDSQQEESTDVESMTVDDSLFWLDEAWEQLERSNMFADSSKKSINEETARQPADDDAFERIPISPSAEERQSKRRFWSNKTKTKQKTEQQASFKIEPVTSRKVPLFSARRSTSSKTSPKRGAMRNQEDPVLEARWKAETLLSQVGFNEHPYLEHIKSSRSIERGKADTEGQQVEIPTSLPSTRKNIKKKKGGFRRLLPFRRRKPTI